MHTPIELQKRRNFSEKVSATVDFIRLNGKALLKCCLVIAGPAILIGALIAGDTYQSLFTAIPLFEQDEDIALEMLSRMGISFFLGILITYVGGLLIISTVYQFMRIYNEKNSGEISVGEVWERVKESFLGLLGTMVLYSLIVILIAMLTFLVIGLFSAGTPFVGIFLVLPAMGLIVYVMVNYSLAFVIKSMEDVSATSTFSRSAKLVKGKWWSTFGIIFITMMIATMVNYMVSIFWSILMFAGIMHDANAEGPSTFTQVITYLSTVFSMLFSQLLQVIPLLAIAFQYFNLVELKEARGLMGKIETFGQTEVAGSDEEHY